MEITNSPNPAEEHPLDKAARLLGGRAVLADRLGVTSAAIGNWKVRGVPIDQCVRIEIETKQSVARRDLRPLDWNRYWPELAEQFIQPARSAEASAAM